MCEVKAQTNNEPLGNDYKYDPAKGDYKSEKKEYNGRPGKGYKKRGYKKSKEGYVPGYNTTTEEEYDFRSDASTTKESKPVYKITSWG